MRVTKVKIKDWENKFISHVGDPRPLQAHICHVVNINGKQMICLPDGTVLPGLQVTSVTDNNGELGTATIEILVNFSEAESIEEHEV